MCRPCLCLVFVLHNCGQEFCWNGVMSTTKYSAVNVRYSYPCKNMKPWTESRIIVLFILSTGCKWRWAVNFIPWQLYPWERTALPIELGEPQNQSGWFWTRGNLLPLLGFEHWTVQPVISHYTDYCLGLQNSTVLRILYSHARGNVLNFFNSLQMAVCTSD